MKNLINYYAAIFLPMICLILYLLNGLSSTVFAVLLLTYALAYRPWIDALRLLALGKISRKQMYLPFIPFWSLKYYSLLFFNRE